MFHIKYSILIPLIFFTWYLTYSDQISSNNVVIRQAIQADLESIIKMDITISYDHFKPIFIQYYAHLPIGQKPDEFLDEDIKNDIKIFHKCIDDPHNDQQLLIAYDNVKQACIGFIIFHRENDILEIDLLMIEKEYRNLGIGKNLIQQALITFSNITICNLFVLKSGNENARHFYESQGFIYLGEPKTTNKIYECNYNDLYFQYQLNIKSEKTHN